MILTSGQLKYYMEEVVRFQHYLKINFRIMIASAILAGFFFLIAIGLNSFLIFGALSGISLAVLITSFIVRSNKCIDYKLGTIPELWFNFYSVLSQKLFTKMDRIFYKNNWFLF